MDPLVDQAVILIKDVKSMEEYVQTQEPSVKMVVKYMPVVEPEVTMKTLAELVTEAEPEVCKMVQEKEATLEQLPVEVLLQTLVVAETIIVVVLVLQE